MEAAVRKARQRSPLGRKKRPGFVGSVETRYGRNTYLRKQNVVHSMAREMVLSSVIADGNQCIESKWNGTGPKGTSCPYDGTIADLTGSELTLETLGLR